MGGRKGEGEAERPRHTWKSQCQDLLMGCSWASDLDSESAPSHSLDGKDLLKNNFSKGDEAFSLRHVEFEQLEPP